MPVSRRQFLASSTIAAAWAAAATACRAAHDAAPDSAVPGSMREQPSPPQQLTHFTAEQGAEVEAITARIIPTDDTPGAREAGVVYFIDRSLVTFASDQQKLFADGLADLAKAVAKAHGPQARFSSLTPAQQDDVLRAMEKTPFFGAIRFATIAGMFALPSYGGNRDYAGWKLIGRAHEIQFTPPFGWYDRPENQQALLGRVL